MLTMTKETRDALRASIQHWRELVAGTTNKIGPHECSLCGLFRSETRPLEHTCEGCPVKEVTGMKYCTGSPYQLASAHILRRQEGMTYDQAVIQAELDFLLKIDADNPETEQETAPVMLTGHSHTDLPPPDAIDSPMGSLLGSDPWDEVEVMGTGGDIQEETDMDTKFLQLAIRLSRERSQAGHGGPFGAVIVRTRDATVVGEGWNTVTSENDPTAHAEVNAIRDACGWLGSFSLKGCTIYTSCEPCPMCLAAIYWARLDRIVYANTRGDAAEIGFDDSTIYDRVSEVVTGRCSPFTQDSLPKILTKHIPSPEALKAFRDWFDDPKRIRY